MATVERPREGGREEIHFILVVGRDLLARVVVRAPADLTVGVHQLPVFAAVVGPPKLSALCGLAVHRDAVAGLDQCVDPVRIALRHSDCNSPQGRLREPVAFETFPGGSLIGGLEQAATRASTRAAPGVDFELPHPGKQDVRVVWIHSQVRAAGVFVHEQHLFPVLPTVRRAEDPALGLRAVRVAKRAGENEVRIVRVNHDVRDPPGLLQTYERPGLARVH